MRMSKTILFVMLLGILATFDSTSEDIAEPLDTRQQDDEKPKQLNNVDNNNNDEENVIYLKAGLVEPVFNGLATTKNSTNNGYLQLGVYQSLSDKNGEIEDTFDIQRDSLGNQYFAIYDGHYGKQTSTMLKNRAIKEVIWPIVRQFNNDLRSMILNGTEFKAQIKVAINNLDDAVMKEAPDGSTLNVVINTPNYLIAINVGDSRSMMVDPYGRVFALTEDQKPYSPSERERILKYGSVVKGTATDLPSRDESLELSRSLGDANLKGQGIVVSDPQVFIYAKNRIKYQNQISVLLIATGSFWDYTTEKRAREMILHNGLCYSGKRSKDSNRLAPAMNRLGKEVRKQTKDDITIVVAIFDPYICTRLPR